MSDPIKITIDTPPATPATGTLLDAADIITGTGPELFFGAQYLNALQGRNLDVPDEGDEKEFPVRDGLTESYPFSMYRGLELSLLTEHGQGPALIEAAFTGSEAFDLEAKVMSLALKPLASDITPSGSTTNVKAAIGLLEQYARENWNGQALISGNAVAINLAADFLRGEPGNLTTVLGTPVSLAAGYGAEGPGASTDAPEGSVWLFISGPIHIWKGPLQVVEGPQTYENRTLALAEASYAVSVDGFAAAILIGF